MCKHWFLPECPHLETGSRMSSTEGICNFCSPEKGCRFGACAVHMWPLPARCQFTLILGAMSVSYEGLILAHSVDL